MKGIDTRQYHNIAWSMRDYPGVAFTVDEIVKLMNRWPGIPKPVERDALVTALDWLSSEGGHPTRGRYPRATLERRGDRYAWMMGVRGG